MTNPSTPSAKDQVIAWVRSKSPQTMELKLEEMITKDCKAMRKTGHELAIAAIRVIDEYDGLHRLSLAVAEWQKVIANEGWRGEIYNSENKILGSDMGLSEIVNAFMQSGFYFTFNHNFRFVIRDKNNENEMSVEYDPLQNAHNQPEEFYQSILPLIHE